ncbi:hypothetical protein EHM69_00600 [candidate division KSB1 bacterium]|nr:MAG: hypothetical protein EHM69_00600 [candidate division KSB1 bacterium]
MQRSIFHLFLFVYLSVFAIPNAVMAQAGSVSGQVVNEKSGRPLSGASVELQHHSQSPYVTDKTGRFSFAGINWGKYTLRVSREGFWDFQKPMEITSDSAIVVTVVLKQKLYVHEDGQGIILQEPCDAKSGFGTIILYVRDRENDRSLSNAEIVMESEYVDTSGTIHKFCCSSGTLDSTGYVKLCNLQPGDHTIFVNVNEYERDRYTETVAPDSTYTHHFRLKKL